MDLNKKLLSNLKSIECPDATYQPSESELVFANAEGSYIFDVNGKRYIDFCSGFGVMALGHSPNYARQIFNEPELLIHGMGDVYPSRPKIDLLREILALLPDHLNRGAFAVTGSQAVEYALKTAMLSTGHSGVIALKGGYHGLDFGALTVTSRQDFREPFQNWLNKDQVEFISPEADCEEIYRAYKNLESRGHRVAAIMAEPIQGRAGVNPLTTDFLQRLRDVSEKNGSLLIFDEIFCGYGRAGVFSFSESINCDITCLGKPMGGGLPLSGFFATEKVMKAWPESKGEAIHTGTFFGHAAACRFGLAVIQEIKDNNLFDRNLQMESFIRQQISELAALRQLSLTGKGLMLAFNTNQPGFGVEWMNLCRAKGLIVLASGVQAEGISITPAFTIQKSTMSDGLKILDETCSMILAR